MDGTLPFDARRLIVTYLVLVFGLSCLSYWPIISSGTLQAGEGIFVLTLMWTPAVAGMVTMFAYRRSLRGMGWGLGPAKYYVIAYLLPIAYAGIVYLVIWALTPGAFQPQEGSLFGLPPSLGLFVVNAATLGFLQSVLLAAGEEIGWRGLLVPQLARVTSFTWVGLISGVVWFLYHLPLIVFADYRGSTPVLYSLACFAVLVLGASFAFAWLRLASGSLWTTVVLHGSHNLFIQSVFDALTSPNGLTPYIVGEFGAGLALTGAIVGLVFWRLGRSQVKPSTAV